MLSRAFSAALHCLDSETGEIMSEQHEQGICDYPGCYEPATITCSMIGCMHRVCETHGNGGMEEAGEQFFPLCWGCDGKGWGEQERSS